MLAELQRREGISGVTEKAARRQVNPATMRYWSTPPHADRETTRRWLERTIAEGHDEFVITLGDRLIGNAGFWRDPEVGFVLDRAFPGQGYAFEAAHAVLARAFEVRGLAVVAG